MANVSASLRDIFLRTMVRSSPVRNVLILLILRKTSCSGVVQETSPCINAKDAQVLEKFMIEVFKMILVKYLNLAYVVPE